MQIITQESLAETLVKRVLADLWTEYTNDKEAHESGKSFDEYVWTHNLVSLGEAAYNAIGEMYGDLDDAVDKLLV